MHELFPLQLFLVLKLTISLTPLCTWTSRPSLCSRKSTMEKNDQFLSRNPYYTIQSHLSEPLFPTLSPQPLLCNPTLLDCPFISRTLLPTLIFQFLTVYLVQFLAYKQSIPHPPYIQYIPFCPIPAIQS